MVDPYGLFELPSIPPSVLNFATGVADAASLGIGPLVRNAMGVDGGLTGVQLRIRQESGHPWLLGQDACCMRASRR